jgi:hypothetical protein
LKGGAVTGQSEKEILMVEISILKFVAALVAALMTGGTFGFMAAAILTNSKRCDIQSGEDKQ